MLDREWDSVSLGDRALQANEYQSEYCNLFDQLESETATLLNQIKVFMGLGKLPLKSNSKKLMGNFLFNQILLDKNKEIFSV